MSSRRPARLTLPLFAAAALASSLFAAPPDARRLSDPEITAREITEHVRYLASAELGGRGSGTRGNDLAADYVAARFRAAGLRPAGEGRSYFQKFPVFTGVKLGGGNRLLLASAGGTDELRPGEDFAPLAYSRNGRLTAPLVFAGYGITAPDLGYDDYRGIDARGKIAVVLRRTPDGDDTGKFGPYAPITVKTMTARDRGAAGILLVDGPLSGEEEQFPDFRRASGSADAGIVAAFVKRRFVEALLAPSARKLQELQVAIAHGQPQSFDLPGARAEIQVEVIRQTAPTRNVIGYLEGSDPELKKEAVVVGAHYDHLGMGGEHSLSSSAAPEIHHGADDNASGTAAVIEMAQHFAAKRKKLGRSLLLIAFSGEEMGLLGSAHWVRNPTIPLKRVVAMINLDMVGRLRNDTLSVIGAGSSPAWQGILDEANGAHGFKLKTGGSSGFGGSDQQSFYARGIPVLFFFTGVHPDYHRPSDTWEKVNAPGQEKLVRFAAEVVRRICWLKPRPAFARAKDVEPAAGPALRVYLGTIPDYAEEAEGVLLQGVREGSPAEQGGLRAGDIIVEFDGKSVRNVQEYTAVIGAAKANVPVRITVLRNRERVTLTVTPAARRN